MYMGILRLDLPSDSNGKGSLVPITALDDGHLSPEETPRPIEDLV